MRKKQLYMDLDALNKLISPHNRERKIIMPDEAGHNEPGWYSQNFFEDLDSVLETERSLAKEKINSPVNTSQDLEATIRESFVIKPVNSKTLVVMVAIDMEEPIHNEPQYIHCGAGIAFGGYVRDVEKDAYILDCVYFAPLGEIPIAYQLSVPGTGGWRIPIPMPERVVEKLLAPYYKRMLKSLREKYLTPRYSIQFLQMVGCD